MEKDDEGKVAFLVKENDSKLTVYYNVAFGPSRSVTDSMSGAENNFIDDRYESGLTAMALFLFDSETHNVAPTPEVKAERLGSATALLLSAKREMESNTKRPKAMAAAA